MSEEIRSYYSVFDRYAKRDDKEIEAWLCRVTETTRNGKRWRQEVEPIAYVYTHEFLNYKFWGIIDTNKIIRDAADRAEFWKPFESYTWESPACQWRRIGIWFLRLVGFLVSIWIIKWLCQQN